MLIRVGTQDEEVVREVIEQNCYGLPYFFEPTDVVIDIGAQIGAFAMECLRRGAGHVECYEPSNDNFPILESNVREVDPQLLRCEIHQKALYRPGVPAAKVISPTDDSLTAIRLVSNGSSKGHDVDCISLDEILDQYQDVRLLKLDCEGAEWFAFYDTKQLHKAQEIVGEIHLQMPRHGYDCSLKGVYRQLRKFGFDVLLTPGKVPECNWNFFAWREDVRAGETAVDHKTAGCQGTRVAAVCPSCP